MGKINVLLSLICEIFVNGICVLTGCLRGGGVCMDSWGIIQ